MITLNLTLILKTFESFLNIFVVCLLGNFFNFAAASGSGNARGVIPGTDRQPRKNPLSAGANQGTSWRPQIDRFFENAKDLVNVLQRQSSLFTKLEKTCAESVVEKS